MDGTVYYVIRRDRHYGPYESQAAAIRDAIDAAHQLGKTNPGGAQVRVQVEDDRFDTQWTSGTDPYPPPPQA